MSVLGTLWKRTQRRSLRRFPSFGGIARRGHFHAAFCDVRELVLELVLRILNFALFDHGQKIAHNLGAFCAPQRRPNCRAQRHPRCLPNTHHFAKLTIHKCRAKNGLISAHTPTSAIVTLAAIQTLSGAVSARIARPSRFPTRRGLCGESADRSGAAPGFGLGVHAVLLPAFRCGF